MSPGIDIVPMVIVPLSFLFVLMIILIVKAPRVGAAVLAGLILVLPLALLAGVRAGLSSHPDAAALVVVPAAFLFVLLIILLTKDPKAGAGLIVALVGMSLIILLVASQHARRRDAYSLSAEREAQAATDATLRIPPPTPTVPVPVIPEDELVLTTKTAELRIPNPSASARPSPSATPAPIWSSGVDTELNADIYPSEFAAARAASAWLGKAIRELAADVNALPRVVVFQEAHPYKLIAELRDAVRRALPEVSCSTESESRTPREGELGVTLYLQDVQVHPAPWPTVAVIGPGRTVQAQPGEPTVTHLKSGHLDINLAGRHGRDHIALRFTEKPWIEDFATFASARPQQAFIIARSLGTCTSEGEANQQALDDACARLTEAIGRQNGPKLGPAAPPITPTDVLQGNFIVDRFAQSLEGSAARIWRQALLLDVSGPKLAQLSRLKAREFRQVRQAWATMGFSTIGVVVLIAAIYFFLNMATRGYYEWSLRIASVVLAVVGVLSILMVVR